MASITVKMFQERLAQQSPLVLSAVALGIFTLSLVAIYLINVPNSLKVWLN